MNWLGDYCNYIKGISSGVEQSGVEWRGVEYSRIQCNAMHTYTCTVSLAAPLITNAVSAVAFVRRPWPSTMGIILP